MRRTAGRVYAWTVGRRTALACVRHAWRKKWTSKTFGKKMIWPNTLARNLPKSIDIGLALIGKFLHKAVRS
jgi:hypothetical protein